MTHRTLYIQVAAMLVLLLHAITSANAAEYSEKLILTPGQQSEIIEAFSDSLIENYVIPENAQTLVNVLLVQWHIVSREVISMRSV